MKRLHAGILSWVACLLVVAFSGCMIGPTQHQDIGNIYDKVDPAGYVLESDMLIEVQAFDWELQRWETVATTRSKPYAITWDGLDWHYWQSPKVQLADKYWVEYWSGEAIDGPEGRYPMKARLRALGDGAPLYTFYDWSLKPLSEMQDDVRGFEVLLVAEAIRIL